MLKMRLGRGLDVQKVDFQPDISLGPEVGEDAALQSRLSKLYEQKRKHNKLPCGRIPNPLVGEIPRLPPIEKYMSDLHC